MAQITYEAVVKLAEQLSPEAQKALIEHLQEIAKQRELSFESMEIDTPLAGEFSDRRVDWYGDGR